jgi:hypothetical protein
VLHNLDLWATTDIAGSTLYSNFGSGFDSLNTVEKVRPHVRWASLDHPQLLVCRTKSFSVHHARLLLIAPVPPSTPTAAAASTRSTPSRRCDGGLEGSPGTPHHPNVLVFHLLNGKMNLAACGLCGTGKQSLAGRRCQLAARSPD